MTRVAHDLQASVGQVAFPVNAMLGLRSDTEFEQCHVVRVRIRVGRLSGRQRAVAEHDARP